MGVLSFLFQRVPRRILRNPPIKNPIQILRESSEHPMGGEAGREISRAVGGGWWLGPREQREKREKREKRENESKRKEKRENRERERGRKSQRERNDNRRRRRSRSGVWPPHREAQDDPPTRILSEEILEASPKRISEENLRRESPRRSSEEENLAQRRPKNTRVRKPRPARSPIGPTPGQLVQGQTVWRRKKTKTTRTHPVCAGVCLCV